MVCLEQSYGRYDEVIVDSFDYIADPMGTRVMLFRSTTHASSGG